MAMEALLTRYAGNPSYVLGFHGCDREVAERVLAGEQDLLASTNDYDWLGHGIYFWEGNPRRAEQWAEQRMLYPESSIREPYAIGAVIDLGFCLSLMQTDHLEAVREAYETLKESFRRVDREMPTNSGGDDRLLRRLDCAVIQILHENREVKNRQPFDSVRSLFQEGSEIYPGSGFHEGSHIQLCVRDRSCIKGYFRPINS